MGPNPSDNDFLRTKRPKSIMLTVLLLIEIMKMQVMLNLPRWIFLHCVCINKLALRNIRKIKVMFLCLDIYIKYDLKSLFFCAKKKCNGTRTFLIFYTFR